MPRTDSAARKKYQREYHRLWYRRNRKRKLAQNLAWQKANREAARRISRAHYWRYWQPPTRIVLGRKVTERRRSWRRYGICPREAEAALLAHTGRCGICGSDTPAKRRRDWAVDHDHVTKIVRGILCHGCNMKLGWVDRVGIAAIAAYLAKSK